MALPLKVVRDDDQSACAAYGASAVLVRPDQYVVWTDNQDAVDAGTVLRRVSGHVARVAEAIEDNQS